MRVKTRCFQQEQEVFNLKYINSSKGYDFSKKLYATMNEPKLTVGILFAPKIEFELFGTFLCNGQEITGKQVIDYDNPEDFPLQSVREDMTLLFTPKNEETDFFELKDVVIGINFHWERKENQRFKGSLKIIAENEKLTAINVISVEDYLTSVISSEMSATASLELLKAHAVISRSNVMEIWFKAAVTCPE